jgi:hypothetical protein
MTAVHDWNDTFVTIVREGGAPGAIARAGAMLHVAVHAAVVAITPGQWRPAGPTVQLVTPNWGTPTRGTSPGRGWPTTSSRCC